MCGIAGVWDPAASGPPPEAWSHDVRTMLSALRHRGPDGEGVAVGRGAVIGACRLAILDPARGQQPMSTADGRWSLAFNGAVVNHVELRAELAANGVAFRTTCDTEVLLELLAREGAEGLARVNGMFAGALLDTESGELLLFRDPYGIKPLYVHRSGLRVLFASEPKALCSVLADRPGLCESALLDYLAFQLHLDGRTFFEGIERLAPGTLLRLRPGHEPETRPLPTWHAPPEIPTDPAAAADVLGALLVDAVRDHLRADVSIGAHLSGGMDSSLVAAHAARSVDRLHVFTGAFDVPGFDERAHARAVAEEIGAHGHEIVPTPDDLARALPVAARAMDEPVAGPGLLPQWCVAELASRHVKVALGGQGGDELFSGYVRHLVLRLEDALRSAVHGGDTRSLRSLAPHLGALDGYEPLLRRHFGDGLFQPVVERHFRLLYRGSGLETVLTGDVREAFSNHASEERFTAAFEAASGGGHGVGGAVRFDRRHVLPALLQVEDRTSMAWSLESRVPLLDRRILSFVERAPDTLVFGDRGLKGLLRRAAGNALPRAARERQDKMGFPVPLSAWARGPLRPFLRDLLLDGSARARGLFDPAAVERILDGESVAARHLWALVNVELWHREHAA